MLTVIILNAIMLGAITLGAIMLSMVVFSLFIHSVILPSVILLSVVAPIQHFIKIGGEVSIRDTRDLITLITTLGTTCKILFSVIYTLNTKLECLSR